MPVKEIYWKNPEHHRQLQRRFEKRAIAAGYPSGRRNPETYLKRQEYGRTWARKHRQQTAAMVQRYKQKVRLATGGVTPYHHWLFRLLGGARAYNERCTENTSQVLQLQSMQSSNGSLK